MPDPFDPLPDAPIDEDLRHEQRQAVAGRVGRIGLGVVLVVALLGACGGAGPLVRTTALVYGQGAGGVQVEYDRFARLDAPTEIVVTLPPADSAFRLTGELARDLRFDTVQPAPASETSSGDDLKITTSPGAVVHLHGRPMRFGRIQDDIRTQDGQQVRISVFVYP